MNNINNGLNDIFYILFQVSKKKNKKNLSYKNVKKWDSLSHVKLILLIESKFNIKKINPEESLDLLSYKRIFIFLTKKLKK